MPPVDLDGLAEARARGFRRRAILQARHRFPVRREHPPQAADIADSLPELLASPHAILTTYELGGRRFVRCTCLDLMEVFGPDSGWMCRLQYAAEIDAANRARSFSQTLQPAIDATCRDEAQLSALLAERQ